MTDTLSAILTDLTGQEPPFNRDVAGAAGSLLSGSGLGYSQFNEILLTLGYDRISPPFFQFLVDGNPEYFSNAAFRSLNQIRAGADRFRILAMLQYGNIKFGFKYLSAPSTDLAAELARWAPRDAMELAERHNPLLPPVPIPSDKTYYLGYLIKQQLEDRLNTNPGDEQARQALAERERVVEQGRRNHEAYLASDHMDVYVATSMRERHEYRMVSEVIAEVFSSADLQGLKLRWFDPTQAYCDHRTDKGLAEGLMLKRAKCTLYLAQESDTLGKDSELASTLAQGKPVIAYVPTVPAADTLAYVDGLLSTVAQSSPKADVRDVVLEQLRVFCPDAAWRNHQVRAWLADRASLDVPAAKSLLGESIRKHYESRARMLKSAHPLGLQVHLETGVANGVLVARSTQQCADLIRRIITATLEFQICEEPLDGCRYLLLKEKSTGSVFRAVTGDKFLTNAFWNFYLRR